MTSTTIETATLVAEHTRPTENVHKEPLQLKGVLDQFNSFDVTPVIGKEFPEVNLKSLLRAENSDELIRDLAITSGSNFDLMNCYHTDTASLATWCRLLPQTGRLGQ